MKFSKRLLFPLLKGISTIINRRQNHHKFQFFQDSIKSIKSSRLIKNIKNNDREVELSKHRNLFYTFRRSKKNHLIYFILYLNEPIVPPSKEWRRHRAVNDTIEQTSKREGEKSSVARQERRRKKKRIPVKWWLVEFRIRERERDSKP